MENNKKSWQYSKMLKNNKKCSREGAVYIYTTQLVSKRFSNNSKNKNEDDAKTDPKMIEK